MFEANLGCLFTTCYYTPVLLDKQTPVDMLEGLAYCTTIDYIDCSCYSMLRYRSTVYLAIKNDHFYIIHPTLHMWLGCSFDNGLCPGWKQSDQDVFNWTNQYGSTPSFPTGPSSDHGGYGVLAVLLLLLCYDEQNCIVLFFLQRPFSAI